MLTSPPQPGAHLPVAPHCLCACADPRSSDGTRGAITCVRQPAQTREKDAVAWFTGLLPSYLLPAYNFLLTSIFTQILRGFL